MEFSIVGQGDPFLHVKLNKGEKIQCESNAMVMMAILHMYYQYFSGRYKIRIHEHLSQCK